MKKQQTLLLIALFAAGQAIAQQTIANTSASKIPTSTEQKFYRLVPANTSESNGDLNSDSDLDTRAWTTVAGWFPGRSAFPDAETYTWQLPLLSIGRPPHFNSPFPIIVLTAFGSPDVKAECLRQGARAFLEKPLDTPHLLGVVEEIFASQTPDPGADAKKEVSQ